MRRNHFYVSDDKLQKKSPVKVLHLRAAGDSISSQRLVHEVTNAYRAGITQVVIDMSHIRTLSPRGIQAMRTIGSLFTPKRAGKSHFGGYAGGHINTTNPGQPRLKLLNLTPEVRRLLFATGIKGFVEIYSDM